MVKLNYKHTIITASIGLLLGCLIFFSIDYYIKIVNAKQIGHNSKNTVIVINKDNQRLSVFDVFSGKIKEYPISTGENPGNKLMKGDLKTPEGVFPVIGIEDASGWTYDFEDGKGPIEGAYGPLFFRLNVVEANIFKNVNQKFEFSSNNKFQGIGIHGTHLNDLIGKRASHGCIRMKNNDLLDLKQYIQPGTMVLINPGKLDFLENTNPKTIIKKN